MKLVFCPSCGDVVRLTRRQRKCKCSQSYGKYLEDGLRAIVGGKAIVLCIGNPGLIDAVQNRNNASSIYERFDAWVLPDVHERIERKVR